MRLFGYYAFHSFINQLRKILKSWVIIFILVCAVGGGAVGVLAGTAADKVEKNQVQEETISPEEAGEKPTAVLEKFLGTSELDKKEFINLGMSAAVLVILLYFIGSADRGGKIFLPADVTLLFPSPLRPQSVLIFRLSARMGLSIFFIIYMIFALLPTMAGTGPARSILLIISWTLVFTTAELLQVFFYLLSESKLAVKKSLRYVILAAAAGLAGAVFLFSKTAGVSVVKAASGILNSAWSNYIPIYGWLKGAIVMAWNGKYLLSAVYLVFSILAAAGLIFVIYRLRADFYESAIEKTEETAEKLEKASESRSGLAIERKKKHSERSRERRGIRHGRGSSVFFYKAMYQRFQSAGHGILTKTSITYLLAAVIGGLFIQGQWHLDGTMASILILVLLVFWRSLGNSLGQDTRMGFYRLIPESPWRKLFFSLFGGTANSFLDLLPALIVISVLFRPSDSLLLTGIGLLLTTDLYATLVSTFLDASIPQSVDKSIHQLVQIVFIYFGIVPDLVILVIGFMKDHLAEALPVCVLVNLTIAVIFFAVTPLVMEDMRVRAAKPSLGSYQGDLKAARKHISMIGLGLMLMIVVSVLAQLLVGLLFRRFFPGLMKNETAVWFISMLPEYLFGFPAGLLLIRKEKADPPESKPLGGKNFLSAIPSTVFMIVIGAMAGQLLLLLLSLISGNIQMTSTVSTLSSMGPVWVRVLFLVILAPLIEEFTFRKTLIDRMRPYGETTAIFFSALAFGLFHGNFSQMFYAFGMGLIFGTIYEKTGRLRYSLALHMAVNFLGGIIVPTLLGGLNDLSKVSDADLPLGLLIYLVSYYGLALIGFVVFTIQAARTRFTAQLKELPRGRVVSTVYGNIGMLLFFAAITVVIVMQTM
jgi:membrane protease YdiL (CAAX protease family)